MGHVFVGEFEERLAIHPHWTGYLLLSKVNNKVIHRNHGSLGTYDISDGVVTVFWENLAPDRFIVIDNVLVREGSLVPSIENISLAKIYGAHVKIESLSIKIPNHDYAVSVRAMTSDMLAFKQIFIDQEYESNNLPSTAENIIDLGANIGLASVFFAKRYPNANILAVEPDKRNYAVLTQNIAGVSDRVKSILGAAWHKDGKIFIQSDLADGSDLGAWGRRTVETADNRENEVDAFGLSSLIGKMRGDIDILKVDVEGAELEIFSQNASEWLPRVKLVVVETHDRFREGSDSAVRQALSRDFVELPRKGENLFFVSRSAF